MLEQLVLSTEDPHPTLQLLNLNGKQGLKGLYHGTELMQKQLVLSTQDPHPTLQLLHLNRNQIKGTVSRDRAGA